METAIFLLLAASLSVGVWAAARRRRTVAVSAASLSALCVLILVRSWVPLLIVFVVAAAVALAIGSWAALKRKWRLAGVMALVAVIAFGMALGLPASWDHVMRSLKRPTAQGQVTPAQSQRVPPP